MTKTITSRQLRHNFKEIKEGLDNGIAYRILYRKDHIANIIPSKKSKQFSQDEIKSLRENWPSLSNGKKISAVELIRKDRD